MSGWDRGFSGVTTFLPVNMIKKKTQKKHTSFLVKCKKKTGKGDFDKNKKIFSTLHYFFF